MNPHDWKYPVHRPRTHQERTPQQRGVENALMMSRDMRTQSRFAAVQPHSSKPVWRDTSPPTHNCQDLDGESHEGLDAELAKKRKELQEINKMILYKKATIAGQTLQHVKPAVPSVSHDQQLDLSPRETLRNRVKQILLRRPFSLFSKLQKGRSESSDQSKRHLQQEDHPLKLRVKALRMHRPGAPFVPPPKRDELPLHQRINSSPEDENKGFECFVRMLNKGVDTSLLEMVSDVHRPLPSRNVPSPTKKENNSNEGHKNFFCVPPEKPGSNKNYTVSDVPQPPSSRNVTSPTKKENDSKERHKNFLRVLNKNKMVLDVPRLSPIKNAAATAVEDDVEKGFKRFLSVLNKGVDVDLLSRIVKDDEEDFTNIPATCVESKSDKVHRSVRQRSDGGSSSPHCKRTIKAESKANPPCREKTLSDAREAKKTKRDSSSDSISDSSSQSGSPQTAKKNKKKKKEEEESPKLDEKQKQLQSILETLGLDLEVEELSRMAERTEERLYGKKTEDNQKVDSRTEQDRQQPSSHRDDQKRRRSHEQDEYQHQTTDKAQRCSHSDEEDLFLKFPHSADQSLSQDTQYSDPSDPHSSVTNPYCSYEENRSNLNNLVYVRPDEMSSRHDMSVLMDESLYPHSSPRDTMLPLNPDLASRCPSAFEMQKFHPLTVISRGTSETRKPTMGQSAFRCLTVVTTRDSESKSQPVEKKLTEEDIKARLREKLQAFNKRPKEVKHLEKTIQPADLLSYELS